ncbi:UDP-glucuronosyltransferase [Gracilibacillus sp. S3-1-1]|uniref:UDP-glucuronosyltransferase n=1 Tax=Gracilibacillus pellucidus TaxID=3095368 RepID=A0ACC6M5T0_9BACI|nr:UDP-glucuronosyltransferase [Gracilibacillus sp. S3-1-1]MDX8046162.1 UDP-glucuronosyltransferase [Gracilibacillus sp. S3-1-1]
MKKVLVLPFLTIPSGHHHVADAMIDQLQLSDPTIQCEKEEIFSYSYGKIEKIVSNIYLQWIHLFPQVYNWLYQISVYKKVEKPKKFRIYQLLFLTHMKKLIKEKRPDCIICTHALPSFMLNVLKEQGEVQIPVVNVYTDFFIHRFWGVNQIDLHFVSSIEMKELLLKRGIAAEKLRFTGIPVHRQITLNQSAINGGNDSLSIMVTGGNLGVGSLDKLISNLQPAGQITYYVLCGKNKQLLQQLKRRNNSHIIPLDYIASRKEMNDLYDAMDGILTKPGGVTISECITKRKPTFIYDALPGQEVINLEQLQQLGVVINLKSCKDVEQQVLQFFHHNEKLNNTFSKLDNYHKQLTNETISDILKTIM